MLDKIKLSMVLYVQRNSKTIIRLKPQTELLFPSYFTEAVLL